MNEMHGKIGPDQGKPYSQKELEGMNFEAKIKEMSKVKDDASLNYEVENAKIKNNGLYPDYWTRVKERFGLVRSGGGDGWQWPKK